MIQSELAPIYLNLPIDRLIWQLLKFVLDRTIGEWVAPPTPKGVLPEWPVAGMIVDNTLWAIVQSWNDDAPTPQLHRAPIANVLTFNGA
jgi:hypothetical protein